MEAEAAARSEAVAEEALSAEEAAPLAEAVTAVIILCTVLCEKAAFALMRRVLGERRQHG